MDKDLGQGEGFALPCNISERLPEEVDPITIFPLRALDTNLVYRHPGSPDSPVCGLYQSDGNPTLDVSARLRVGLNSLFCEATGYPFKGRRQFHNHQPIGGENGGRELLALLEACLQVHLLLRPLRLL